MFVSRAALDLVPGITVTGNGVYLRNMSTGATTLVSVNNTGTDTGDGILLLDGVAISPNGRYVTWAADSNNVVTGVSNSGNGWQEFRQSADGHHHRTSGFRQPRHYGRVV